MKNRRRNNYSVKYDILFYGNGIFQYTFSVIENKILVSILVVKRGQ